MLERKPGAALGLWEGGRHGVGMGREATQGLRTQDLGFWVPPCVSFCGKGWHAGSELQCTAPVRGRNRALGVESQQST